VQPELISLKSSHHKDFTSLLKTPATLAAKAEIPEAVNSNARQRRGTLQISQAGNAEGVYVAEVKIRFVNSRGEAVDKKGNPVEGRISEDFIRGELKLKPGDNYSPSVVRSDLQQLQQLGLFDKVTVSIEEVGTDINVIYNVQERSARSFGVSASLSDDIGVAVPLSYTDRTFARNPQRLAGGTSAQPPRYPVRCPVCQPLRCRRRPFGIQCESFWRSQNIGNFQPRY
jgi:outer membrane protein insertion porin family